jgi:hypothetical protein
LRYARGREVIVDHPRLSIIAGVTPTDLETYTRMNEWQNGFMARNFVFRAERERLDSWPLGSHHQLRPHLAAGLARMHTAIIGECRGFDSTRTTNMWLAWCRDLQERYAGKVRRSIEGTVNRLEASALRIAMLLSLDYGQAGTQNPWHITRAELIPAMRLAELHFQSALTIGEGLSTVLFERRRRSVLEAVGGLARPYSETLSRVHPRMSKRDFDGVLETLKAEGTLHQDNYGGVDYLSPFAITPAPQGTNVVPFPAAVVQTAQTTPADQSDQTTESDQTPSSTSRTGSYEVSTSSQASSPSTGTTEWGDWPDDWSEDG